MQTLNRRLIALFGVLAAASARLVAQPVAVTGTGNPDIDVPAVQAAVDKGGHVVLTGHFSFDRPPTTPDGTTHSRMVTVSQTVVISGSADPNGDMATIEGGNRPFFVDAGDGHVTIENLHFVRPVANALWVNSAGGLQVTGCRIENVQPTVEFGMEAGQANPLSGAIFVGADPHPPNAAYPGAPGNFSGRLAILNNDIDVGATPDTQTLGVVVFAVGRSPDKEVDIFVNGNNIRNVTEPAINFRVVGGRAYAERNVLTTGTAAAANPDAIRLVGSGTYLVAHNTIDCGWADGGATGINVAGQAPPMAPAANAVIVDNDITMSAPDVTDFTTNSAAIEAKGFAQGASILNNRIRGRARAALSVLRANSGSPGTTTFVSNDIDGFQPSLADIFVDVGATTTVLVGRQARLEDHGTGTVVVTIP